MIIVDASIVFKWIKSGEHDADKALLLYNDHIYGKEEVLVPSLLFIEIANAIATKSKTTEKVIKQAIHFLYAAQLHVYEEGMEDILEVSVLAKKHKTSVYDMLYAVIAKRKKIFLITADAQFVKKTRFSFVKAL